MGGIIFVAIYETYFKTQKGICEKLGSRETNNKLISKHCSNND